MLKTLDSFCKINKDPQMKFSLEIGPQADLETLPSVKDVYITMLPGGDYVETAQKAGELVKKGFYQVPHFPARSISDESQLNDYVSNANSFPTRN